MGTVRRITVAAAAMLTLLGATVLGTARPAAAADLSSRLINGQSGYCMDDYARTRIVYHYPCNEEPNQLWYWERPSGGGTENRWLIRSRESGYCLYPTANHYYAEVRLARCAGDGSQQWRWVRYAGTDYWLIEHLWPDPDTQARLCVATGNSDTISKLVLGACQGWLAHLWFQEPPR